MKQLGELIVGDYMSPQAIVIDDTAHLNVAIRLMDSEQVAVLPVVNEQSEVVGILSTSDLLEIIREIQADLSALNHVNEQTQDFLLKILIEQGDGTLVRDVMTAPAVTVSEDLNMVLAAKQIVERGCHHLPVVNQSGKPTGILSTTDIVRAYVDHGGEAAG